ncbi:hypothetical protein BDR26DRAFT_860583, partial [Obelidium mucronatum]
TIPIIFPLVILVITAIASAARFYITDKQQPNDNDFSLFELIYLDWVAHFAGLVMLTPPLLPKRCFLTGFYPTKPNYIILLMVVILSALTPGSLKLANAAPEFYLYSPLAVLLLLIYPSAIYGGLLGTSLVNLTALLISLWAAFLTTTTANYQIILFNPSSASKSHLMLLHFHIAIQITGLAIVAREAFWKSQIQKVQESGTMLMREKLEEVVKENRESEVKKLTYLKLLCMKAATSASTRTNESPSAVVVAECTGNSGCSESVPALNSDGADIPKAITNLGEDEPLTTIQEYLLYLEIEMNHVEVVPVVTDLEELLANRIENVYTSYKNLGIKFRHEFNALYDWIRVDPVRIEQIVLNALLSPIQYLDRYNSILSSIAIKSSGYMESDNASSQSSSAVSDNSISYFMELTLHVCGVSDVSSFESEFKQLLNPFNHWSATTSWYHAYTTRKQQRQQKQHQRQTPQNQQQEHQEIKSSTLSSHETLALSEECQLVGDPNSTTSTTPPAVPPTTLSLAIAYELTKRMKGSATLLTGFKRVTLHFQVPVEVCSTAQVLSAGRRFRIGTAATVSLPTSARNSPDNDYNDLFAFSGIQPAHAAQSHRPSILKSLDTRSSTLSKKTVRLKEEGESCAVVGSHHTAASCSIQIDDGIQSLERL